MIFGAEGFAPTPRELIEPEAELLATLGGVSAVWTGRAATALYWAYRIARLVGGGIEKPEIIVPAISCASPGACVLAADCSVRCADVDPSTGMITLETVQQRWSPRTRAVVFIHLYGQTADLAALAAWCRERGIVLIEDLAQAQGARLPGGAPAGTVGDLVVYSFNRTKILESGGGALVFRSPELADFWQEIREQSSRRQAVSPERTALLALSLRDLYHSLISLRRLNLVTDVSESYLQLQHVYFSLYVEPLRTASILSAQWAGAARKLEHRVRNAEAYSEGLSGGPWLTLDGWRQSGVCWRYSLLLDSRLPLVEFTEAVRRDGFWASNLYWPLNEFLCPQDVCPHAASFGRRVVNLWVDETVTPERAGRCARSLQTHAEALARA
jgi:dTDP-4-amino-4,6-dideoxygalactose transaminase